MKCIICHGEKIEKKSVKEECVVDNDIVYVPLEVLECSTCGERYYDRKTKRYLEDIQKKHLIPYTYPRDDELKRIGVTGIFLGYYLPWDGYSNALIAQGHGFNTYQTTIEGSCVNYENLDNHQTGIHDYFK